MLNEIWNNDAERYDLSGEIFVQDCAQDRCGVGTAATVLQNHSHGNLRVIGRCIANQYGIHIVIPV